MNNKSLKLKDIAELAGVSRTTASRVINNDPNVNDETRARVLAVIQREKYRPNFIARSMVTNRTQVLGVVLTTELPALFADPYYFPTLLQGIAGVANDRDYGMLLWTRNSGEDESRFYLRILKKRLIDGLILASMPTASFLDQIFDAHIPFVMVEQPIHYADRVSYVGVDNAGAAMMAVDHLLRNGRTRIGMLTGPLTSGDALNRYHGYLAALERVGLTPDPDMIYEGHQFTRADARLGVHKLLQAGVDAIFASNDQMAHGVYDVLTRVGRRIPEDIAVVGFDDLPTAVQLDPTLTSVRQPIEQKGALATRMLIDQLENEQHDVQQILLPTTLVVRQSCGMTTN